MAVEHIRTVNSVGGGGSNVSINMPAEAQPGDIAVLMLAFDDHVSASTNVDDYFQFSTSSGHIHDWERKGTMATGTTVVALYARTIKPGDGTYNLIYKSNSQTSNSRVAVISIWRGADLSSFEHQLARGGSVGKVFEDDDPYVVVYTPGYHGSSKQSLQSGFTAMASGTYVTGGNYVSMTPMYQRAYAGGSKGYTNDFAFNATGNSSYWAITYMIGENIPKPPSKPTNISYTFDGNYNHFVGGYTTDVSASGSVDPEQGPITYEYRYTFKDPSGTVKTVTGAQTSGRFVVPDEDGTITFEARAKDEQGLYSDWATIAPVEVRLSPKAPGAVPTIGFSGGVKTDPSGFPDTYLAGSYMDVAWSAATDPNGDALTYELELLTDPSKGSWTSLITNTGERAYRHLLPQQSLKETRYRVRATDPGGLKGDWTVSPTFHINRAPSQPASLTHNAPAIALAGTSVTVTASESVDPEGRPVTYKIVAVTDGAETVLADRTPSRTATHTLPVATVADVHYKVLAYDEVGANNPYGYQKSTSFKVDRPPSKPSNLTHSAGDAVIGGRDIIVNIGTASDPEGKALTYHTEFFDGTDWNHVRTGASRTLTHRLPEELATGAKYRTRAIDVNGFESDWTESAAFDIFLNPTAPGSVTHNAATIAQVGDSVSITAIGSADPAGGALTYDFSFWDGNTWTDFEADTEAATVSHTLPYGSTSQARYRARSKNVDGYVSEWSESAVFRLNAPPTNPASVTHNAKSDGTQIGGRTVTVTAGTSTDPEGKTVRHTYEFHDGTSWSDLAFDTTSKTYQHTLPDADLASVKYRVRTTDTEGGWSAWVESGTFGIQHSLKRLPDIALPKPNRPQDYDNLKYLRETADRFRSENGLTAFAYDPVPVVRGETRVMARHMNELQQAILGVFAKKDEQVTDPAARAILNTTVLARDESFTINKDMLKRYEAMITAMKELIK